MGTEKRLSRIFFERQTLEVAKALLGKFLVRRFGRRTIVGMITETEAYVGPHDRASHASRGRTPRTEVMFGQAGHAYVYLIYGIHCCLNVVTERDGFPAAVLFRSVRVGDIDIRGPGRVCRAFRVTRSLNREDLVTFRRMWIEDRGVRIASHSIRRGPRVGVDYAGEWKRKPWRFSLDPTNKKRKGS